MSVNPDGVSTMAPVTSPVKHVRHGPTQVQSAEAWVLTYLLLKARKKMFISSTDTMVIKLGSVWMTLLPKDCSPGWMDALTDSATGLKTNRTTSGGRTVCTLLGQGMGTCGMTWIVLPAISTRARKVLINRISYFNAESKKGSKRNHSSRY